MDSLTEQMENVSLRHNNDKIEIDCDPTMALTIFKLLILNIVNEGSSHDHYDEAEICLNELNEIEGNNRDKISTETDNFLSELQLEDDYNNYCRLFRYFYGYGIYDDTVYKKSVIKLIDYLKNQNDIYDTYKDALDYALIFFDDDNDDVDGKSLMDLQAMRTDISLNTNIPSDIMYLTYDILDYIDLSIDFS